MNAELEQALRSSAPDLTLDTPAADVLEQGDRFRRRRRRGIALGASGVVAVTALGVAALNGQQPDRGVDEAADPTRTSSTAPAAIQVASWSGPATNLSPQQLADVQATCAASGRDVVDDGLTEPGWGLAGTTPPAAAELRDGLVLTYFRQGRDYATCAAELTTAGGFRVVAQSAGVERSIPAGRHVAFVTAGAADPGPLGGPLTGIYAVARTSSDVASLRIAVAGDTYDSPADGLGLFWLPDDELTQAELGQATVTALDDEGAVLDRLEHVW